MEAREKMIEAIYNKIADKTLSFGCKFLDSKWKEHKCILAYDNDIICYWFTKKKHSSKIIWHTVMFWDCWEYFNNSICDEVTIRELLAKKWEHKRKSIEGQSEDCIKFVFDNLNLWQEKN